MMQFMPAPSTLLIEAVQADAHRHRAAILELLRNFFGDHHAVGAKHRAQAL